MFREKDINKNLTKFTGKRCAGVSFLVKLQGRWLPRFCERL